MVKLSLPHPIPITNPTSPFRNFNFMRPIKIVGSDTDLHDYQVRIHLDHSNFPLEKCKPDGSDIRFRDDSGEILPYWIERWNAAEGVIWCKIPFIPAESSKFIWMIYGNPNAKSESNGNAVFELFDVQGIVGFWHFDEPQWTGATGEVRDETGMNHGTAKNGATTTSDAKYGRAGYFDGEVDYVEVPDSDSLDITDEITIEAWVKSNTKCGFFVKKYGGKGYVFGHNSNNEKYFFLVVDDAGDNHSCASNINIQYGKWTHVVGVFKAYSYQQIYVNGNLDTHVNATWNLRSDSADLLIGFKDWMIGCAGLFNGKIDELRIYNRALSPTEIQILSKNYMQKMGSYFNVRKYVTPAPVVIV